MTWLAALRLLGRGVATRGAVRLQGMDLTRLGEREIARVRGGRIGLIFQDPTSSLNPVQRIGTQLGEVLALMGDSVDNVPGVPGVGPKTAAKLILEHGSVEGVIAAAPDMKKGKLRDNLIEHAEMARLSLKLVTLACDVPLPQRVPLGTPQHTGGCVAQSL